MLANFFKYLFNISTDIDINKILKIYCFNLFYYNSYDIKKKQITYLNESDADIIFLQEYDDDMLLDDLITNYVISDKVPSHMGYTFFLINKNLNPKIDVNSGYKKNGIIINKVNTIYGTMVCGSLHLLPFSNRHNERAIQIKEIHDWLKEEIDEKDVYYIISGDTNMDDSEDIIQNKNFLTDIYLKFQNSENSNYCTYPNHTFLGPKYKGIFKRYDKILIRNCTPLSFNVIDTKDSDHFMIQAEIKLDN
jgi:hypothetical protein